MNPTQASAFLALRAEISLGLGRFTAALEWAREALASLTARDSLTRVLEISRVRALIGLGRFREAQSALEGRLMVLDAEGVEPKLFRAHVALHSGRLGDATLAASEACASAISIRDRAKLVEALLVRARSAREQGEAKSAASDLDRAQGLCSGLRDMSALATVLSERADLMAHTGDWSEASKDASRSGRLFARAFSPHEHVSAGRRTGLLGLAQGEPEAALSSIEKAAEVARRGFGTTEGRAEIDLLLADAQLAGRDSEGALERATNALSFFRHAQDPGGLARAHVRRSLAALSAANMALAYREARIAQAVEGAGPVAAGLADLALGRVLLRKDSSAAAAPFDRAASNGSLYPPLRSVASLGAALAVGASPHSDVVQRNLGAIEAFGDRRILAIVRSDLRELFGWEPSSTVAVEGKGRSSSQGDSPVDPSKSPAEFLPGLVGVSKPVLQLRDLVRKAAPSELRVSIYGETGTGKENVARAIHALSPRASRKFVPINAASLSDELFESQLFGHLRGSFTGAQSDRAGMVEEAKGGTLFIDEVADLSPRSQVRLLRFLEDGTYRRMGENHERRADVRIVVASNQPLPELVRDGRFRIDLLHRLQGMCLTVPPLRLRGRDVVHLARHFVALASARASGLSPGSEGELLGYAWPGNVRELEQEMKRAVVLAESRVIDWKRPQTASVGASPLRPAPGAPDAPEAPLHEAVGGFERSYLKSVLSRCAGRVEAARLLGISRQALHQKILRYGL
jgi:DNA-binding NtrC family response regulator/tetratricopeptide (TPR) repeat protein